MSSTPEQAKNYLIVMDEKLKARNPQIQLWENYYEGVHRLQFATSRFRATFGNLFREFADNWCELIVNASVERLKVIGFRTEDGTLDADKDASRIWRDNAMASQLKMAFTEAVKLGESYLLVDGENTVEDTDSPLITVEHPSQAFVLCDPANPRRRVAGLKEWVDDETGKIYATVYMPDFIYRFEAEEKEETGDRAYQTSLLGTPSAEVGRDIEWVARKNGVPFYSENTLKAVPLIPLRNNPTLSQGGRSDISVVIPVQDAVNKLVSDMMIASEFASFAQRWATGLDVPKDPETGRPMANSDFLASVGRVWVAEHQDAKFGQFEATDLRNYVHAIEMLIQHVAALTRTPPHYLLGQSGAFPSGDSLTATETGLTAKVEGKWDDFDPDLCQATNLALRAKKIDRRAQETIWRDAERRIRSQRIDGAMKLSTLGVPQDAIWGDELGATPEQIDRWHNMKKEMGLDEHSSLFAVPPPLLEGEKPPTKTNAGPEGNLQQEQAASQTARVARIHD
jgi:hypothetical protein